MALKCLELLARMLSSAQHCVHRILNLLFPFALILRPQTARHLSFARAVVTSILADRTIEAFNWTNHAKSKIFSILVILYASVSHTLTRFIRALGWLAKSSSQSTSASDICSLNSILVASLADWFALIGIDKMKEYYVGLRSPY